MSKHDDLTKPELGEQDRVRNNQMWSDLITLLSAAGEGAVKPVDKTKKTGKPKKKKKLDRLHASSTGGGSSRSHCLTAPEESVVAVLGVSAVSGQSSSQECGTNTAAPLASVPAIAIAYDVEDIVVPVPNSPALHLPASPPPCSLLSLSPSSPLSPPHTSPPPPSLLPPPPSFLSLPSSSLPSPRRVSLRRQRRTPRQRSRFPRASSTAEARRNRIVTPFDWRIKAFAAVEQRRLDIEERRLDIEERRLVLEDERERRRLDFEKERNRRLHDRDMQMVDIGHLNIQFMKTLADISQRVRGSSSTN